MGTFDVAELRRLDQATHLHPFTDHRSMHREGTHIIRSGRGCFVVDETGRQLLDGLAGLWCVNVGYGRAEIVDAVRAQMETLAYYPSFFNSTTEPTIRLAAKLATLAPPRLGHTIFSNSGSEANETALKLIRGYWKLRGRRGKTKVLARSFAYHGVTLATASLTGLPSCTEPFDLPLPGFVQVPGPLAYGSGKSPADYARWCLEETERVIAREGAETIAAGADVVPYRASTSGLATVNEPLSKVSSRPSPRRITKSAKLVVSSRKPCLSASLNCGKSAASLLLSSKPSRPSHCR